MSDPAEQSLPPGYHLAEFEIIRVLGSGGFGITYLARDHSLEREVVIKENLPLFAFRDPSTSTVHPKTSKGEDTDLFAWSLESFVREARTLAKFDHPNIVKILRVFHANGTAYFVMPYVEGETFSEWIAERKKKGETFAEDELRALLLPLLEALEVLNGKQVYHRDIKPGNVLVTSRGTPMLIDFGAARQMVSERSHTVVESPGYTPFEQLQSRGNVGPWSDLYGLAATFYKALTFENPPKANDRVKRDPIRVLSKEPDLLERYSATLLEAVDRALNFQEEERPQSAAEMHALLVGESKLAVIEKRVGMIASEEVQPVPLAVEMPPVSTLAGDGGGDRINFTPPSSTMAEERGPDPSAWDETEVEEPSQAERSGSNSWKRWAAVVAAAAIIAVPILLGIRSQNPEKGEERAPDAPAAPAFSASREIEDERAADKPAAPAFAPRVAEEKPNSSSARTSLGPSAPLAPAKPTMKTDTEPAPGAPGTEAVRDIGTVKPPEAGGKPTALTTTKPPPTADMAFANAVPGNPLVVTLPGANASLGQISIEKYDASGNPTGEPLKKGTEVQIPDPNIPGKKIYFKIPGAQPAVTASSDGKGMEGTRAGEVREFGGIKMIWCPPGEFLMGSPTSEADRSDDEMQHRVTLTRGFWMAKTETTQRQWEGITGENPSHFKGGNLPVETVSWDDVQGWLTKMNADHPLPSGWKWVLPTEAQWEYACRAGTETAFSFGSMLNGKEENCCGHSPYGTSAKGPYLVKTKDVGGYAANTWGLYDMHGNVREWCADYYGDYPSGSATDPKSATTGSDRVLRGGSWLYFAVCCRSAFRTSYTPDYRYYDLGFRVAAVPAGR